MSVTVISDIVNDMISVIVSRAENKTSTSTSRRNITAQTKVELADYFNRCNFPSNQTLPRHNSPGHEELDAIIATKSLSSPLTSYPLTTLPSSDLNYQLKQHPTRNNTSIHIINNNRNTPNDNHSNGEKR